MITRFKNVHLISDYCRENCYIDIPTITKNSPSSFLKFLSRFKIRYHNFDVYFDCYIYIDNHCKSFRIGYPYAKEAFIY